MLNDPRLRRRARLVAISLAVIVIVAPAVEALARPKVAAAAASCSLSQMSSSSQPACWHPFSGGPFNTELSSPSPLATNSAAVVSHMTAYHWSVGDPGSGFTVGAGSRPVFFATPSDPTMTIVCTNALGSGSCRGANGVEIAGQAINVPAGARPENGSDGHLTVIESATGAEYDFWDASISGSTISAGTGSVVNVNTGNGLGAQGDAANFALAAGLLRPSELASGAIDHALVVTVPCTSANGPTVGYSWPATGGWGEACGDYWNESVSGAPLLGQLLRLNLTDQQIAASPAPAWQKTIMTALAHYGAYIEDTDGSFDSGIDVITQDSASWTDLGLPDQWAALEQQYGESDGQLSSSVPIPVSELQVVNACVPLGSCPAPATASPSASAASVPFVPATPAPPPVAPATLPASATGSAGGSVPSASAPVQAQKPQKHQHKRHRKQRHEHMKQHRHRKHDKKP